MIISRLIDKKKLLVSCSPNSTTNCILSCVCQLAIKISTMSHVGYVVLKASCYLQTHTSTCSERCIVCRVSFKALLLCGSVLYFSSICLHCSSYLCVSLLCSFFSPLCHHCFKSPCWTSPSSPTSLLRAHDQPTIR